MTGPITGITFTRKSIECDYKAFSKVKGEIEVLTDQMKSTTSYDQLRLLHAKVPISF